MTISVWCPTRDPGPRLRSILEMLRPVADEIVVAVDSRVDPALLGHHAAVADRLVRFEYADPMERVSTWLMSICSGDWLLRIDGDDVPSPKLVAALPQLAAADDVHQYPICYRWLYPDASTYLNEPPWNYTSTRLLRNDPARLWVPGRIHSGPEPVFPSRILTETPIYHLNALVADVATRAEKLRRRYLGGPEEFKSFGSDRDSRRFYLPEQAGPVTLGAVPEDDQFAIERVLRAAGPELPTPTGLEIPLYSRAEIDAHWAERSLDPGAYRAVVTIVDRDLRFMPGQHRPVSIRVTNRGDTRWPGGQRKPLVRAAYRLFAPDGTVVAAEGYRTDLPGPFPPGHVAVVPLLVAAPDRPGSYRLQVDLVHEHVRWFEATTEATLTVTGQGGSLPLDDRVGQLDAV
jgi:hypothetical protein